VTASDADLLAIACGVAVEAGDLAMRRRSAGVTVAATKSSPVDVVTETDREVEAFIRGRLAQLRPDDGFFGEESDAAESASGLTWIVDPIDGTVNFLYGIPAWAVSVAVVEGGPDPRTWTAIAGCVVNPVLGEVFTAARGQGAFLGDRRIAVSGAADLALSLIGTGFAYAAESRSAQAAIVAELIGQTRDVRRIGSASLDLCSVAAGRLDAYYERGLSPWDHAAGALIAAEAGAVVGGLRGAPADRDMTMAATPGIATALELALITAGL
jgi:myo-inositol-1(or 4)-monophosphatase